MFQIGNGYFGIAEDAVKPSKIIRDQAKLAFEKAFAIPASKLNIGTGTKTTGQIRTVTASANRRAKNTVMTSIKPDPTE